VKRTVFLFLAVILLAQAGFASYISLQTTVKSRVEGNTLTVLISSVNKGDEPAHSVQAEVRLGKRTAMLSKVQELRVNGTYQARTTFPLAYKVPGEYPLVVVMHYADANLYPFSALNCQTFAFRSESRISDLFGKMGSATFWEKGRIRLSLKNMSGDAVQASTYLVVPREISVAQQRVDMLIPAHAGSRADFELENFSALNGSSYQVFAVTEHESGGIHQTAITPGMVRLAQARELFGLSYPAILMIMAALALIFFAAQFLGKGKKKAGA